MIRATTTHIDKYGVTHRIDLERTGYGGASTELRGTDGFLLFSHENLSESDVFSTPIQKGRLDYGVWIDSDSQKAVIDEILVSQEGEFIVKWYQNNVLFWTGTVALDLSTFEEASYPYRAQIIAKDLTFIEGVAFPTYADALPSNAFDTRRRLISIIAECLPYGLNIVTSTSWIESNINSAQDFLRQVYLDASSLSGLTKYAVLERIMSANGLFLKQSDGVWLIDQLSAHTTPASVTRWTYNSSGVYQSEAVVNPIITANTNLKVVTGSISSVAPAYKQVSIEYDALMDEALEIPETVEPSSGSATTFSQQYISTYNVFPIPQPADQIQEFIRFSATGIVTIPATSQSSASKRSFDVRVQINAGDQWAFYNPNTGSASKATWFSGSAVNIIARAYFSSFDVDPQTGAQTATYKAQFNLETESIPAPVTNTNYGRLSVSFFPEPVGAIGNVSYENVKFELVQGEVANIYQLTQANQYSSTYSQTVYMGDGPRAYAKSSLRYATGNLSLDKITEEWQRRGSTDWRAHSVNLGKEIMDFQRTYGRTIQVQARGSFSPSNTLSYDTLNWFYIGGTFDGFTGDWTMTFVRNSFVPALDSISATGILRPASIGTGIIANIANQSDNTIQATGQFLLRLLLPASGTISQIIVDDIDDIVDVREGQILRLVHPISLQSEEVTVASDRNGSSFIDIVTTTLSGSYPIGAYIFVSAQSVQAGILVGENAVRIYAEGQKVGRLNGALTGLITSIPCFLYTKVIKGTELQVVNSTTGDSYSITVDDTADTYGPGSVSLAIESQIIEAPNGSYIVGDNAWQSSAITVTQGLIVLKVDSNGRVAQVKLSADQDSGSEIDISAEQVKINGIIFTEGTDPLYDPGDIKTSDYVAGTTGWAILGDGTAEFNDVTVRGEIEAQSGSIEGTLSMGALGKITGSSGDTVWEISNDEILFQEEITSSNVGTVTIAQRSVTITNRLVDVNSSFVARGGYIKIVHDGNTIFEVDGYASTPKVNMASLPTSDTGLDVGDLWRDGNTVKVKT